MYNILVTCFNASLYIRRCLDTLRFQTFADWRCYVMDDLSTDDSLEVARAAVDGDDRFVFIKNSTKHYQIGNYVAAISRFDDEDVCITVDGDDWLPDRNVLQRVHNAYQDGAWMTWGSHLVFEPNGNVYRGQGEPLYDPATLRCEKWFPSHLRTWKTFLWRRIHDEDLRDLDTGEYWTVAGDMSFMYPMSEMAGNKGVFLDTINYCYNYGNHLGNHVLRRELQLRNDRMIRSKRPYVPRLAL